MKYHCARVIQYANPEDGFVLEPSRNYAGEERLVTIKYLSNKRTIILWISSQITSLRIF